MMTRTGIHLDAILRHLGAAYYDSLHGRASRTDVARALATVEDHLGDEGARHSTGTAQSRQARKPGHRGVHHQPGPRHATAAADRGGSPR